jgi:hypothetical protein
LIIGRVRGGSSNVSWIWCVLTGRTWSRHLGSQELVAAIRGAGKRPLGDSWAWGRLKSDADICPLVAVTLALGTLEATDVPEPFVLFGGGS